LRMASSSRRRRLSKVLMLACGAGGALLAAEAARDCCLDSIHDLTVDRKASGRWQLARTASPRVVATIPMLPSVMPWTIFSMCRFWLGVQSGWTGPPWPA